MNKFIENLKKRCSEIKAQIIQVKNDFKNINKLGVKETLKRRKSICLYILCFIVIVCFIVFNNIYLSKEEVLEEFKKSLMSDNALKVSKYIKVDNESISQKELQPLVTYYKNEEEKINKTVNEIRKSGKSGIFTLESKKGILGEKYYISIKTVVVKFVSDINNIEVQFENKKFNLKDEAEFDAIPGFYTVDYTYNTEYGDITGKIDINLMENKTVDIKIDGNYITLYSNFDDAKVFINNNETNLEAKDIKNYGPIPKNKEINIFIQRDFPWGTIKSEEVKVGEQQYIKLDINMVNDELMLKIEKVVNEFYSSSFQALNNKDESSIVNATENVKSMAYDYINEKALLLTNNYEITDLQVEIEKSDFKYEDENYKASLVTKISYNVYKKLLPFIKTPNESSFILSLEYKDGTFIINGIQKIDI